MVGYRVSTVDVFSDVPLLGNPVAVVHDADDLTDETMAAFARWTNLSETTFLLRPTTAEADYRLRIFTPGGELPFAGHPTLGSARAWLAAGGRPRTDTLVQECGAGLVPIRRDGDLLAFAAPPLLRRGTVDQSVLTPVLAALGLPHERVASAAWVDNGPGWLGVLVDSADTVLELTPQFWQLREVVGVVGPYPPGAACAFEVRAFAPTLKVDEDPVTGSLNAGLALWLIGTGRAPDRYVAAQGSRLGRRGRVHVIRDGTTMWVGGAATVLVDGRLSL